jgi:hypothetical protein
VPQTSAMSLDGPACFGVPGLPEFGLERVEPSGD